MSAAQKPERRRARTARRALPIAAAAVVAATLFAAGCAFWTHGPAPDDRDEHGRTVEERLADDDLASRVELAIARDRALPGASVTATAVRGVVTLEGTVASDAERRHALGRARLVEGVAGVVDELRMADADR